MYLRLEVIVSNWVKENVPLVLNIDDKLSSQLLGEWN